MQLANFFIFLSAKEKFEVNFTLQTSNFTLPISLKYEGNNTDLL